MDLIGQRLSNITSAIRVSRSVRSESLCINPEGSFVLDLSLLIISPKTVHVFALQCVRSAIAFVVVGAYDTCRGYLQQFSLNNFYTVCSPILFVVSCHLIDYEFCKTQFSKSACYGNITVDVRVTKSKEKKTENVAM